ncbi:MAG: pyridoxamine 5'-phosphate oxidase family protein [Pseudohongiellaceae bacterium]|nr:pyridoxamine 5'-phosphate oxidase family protein [Pseudohongiellaceae bacterium]
MAEQFPGLNEKIRDFIARQHIYFVGTAAGEGRVNVSPKGRDSLRIIDDNKVIWLNLTGSGNESAAHILDNNRMTIMFCSFDKQPLILRLYGKARAIHPRDSEWDSLLSQFEETVGARQIFELDIDLVQTSCGYAVPKYSFETERDTLKNWAEKKGPEEVEKYWRDNNVNSMDGLPTNILGDV